MKFNYQARYKQFRKKERQFVIQAFREGMKKEEIREILKFDWEEFKSDRRYCEHNQRLEMFDDPDCCAEKASPIQKRFNDVLAHEDCYLESTINDIIEMISDKTVYKALTELTDMQKDLLYEVSVLEHRLGEIADDAEVSRAAISQRMSRIKAIISKKI